MTFLKVSYSFSIFSATGVMLNFELAVMLVYKLLDTYHFIGALQMEAKLLLKYLVNEECLFTQEWFSEHVHEE